MKFEIISAQDRSVIINALNQRPEWEGKRSACRLRLVRFHAPQGERIHWAVQTGRYKWVDGESDTVIEALQECERLIAGAPVHGTKQKRALETPGSRVVEIPAPQQTSLESPEWLPYKDAPEVA